MAIFTITLFALALALLPLQWRLPSTITSNLTSDPWNGPVVLLALVQIIFYLAIVLSGKKWLRREVTTKCLWATLALIATVALQWYLSPSSAEILRLLCLIWFVPLLDAVTRQLGSARSTYLVICLMVVHALWGVSHFVFQDDLGLYLLGETRLDVSSPGIAKFAVESNSPEGSALFKVLRAYGPYPHPNSLAGVLVIGWCLSLLLLRRYNMRSLFVLTSFIFLGVLVTFSRSAAVAIILSLIIFFYLSKERSRRLSWVRNMIPVILLTLLVFSGFWVSRLSDPQDVAGTERVLGTTSAWQLWQQHPWRGVGLGNYETALRQLFHSQGREFALWQIAPVHSVPLLLLVQLGLSGTILWLFTLLAILKTTTRSSLVYVLPLLPLLIFDHYLFTQTAPLVMLLVYWKVVSDWVSPNFLAGAPPTNS